MNVKKVRYIFFVLYLIMLALNLFVDVKHGFWILMGLILLETIAYSMAEKRDKK